MKTIHLTRSAALFAASVAGAGSALAADLAAVEPQKEVFFSIQGGALEGEAAADKLGLAPDDEFAITGAVAFGRDIDEDWDWRLRIFGTGFDESSASDGGTFISNDLDYIGGDVEFGHVWGSVANGAVVRAFAGLRVLSSEDDLVVEAPGYSDWADGEFLGAGPRAGAEFAQTFGTGTFGISGGVSAAWLIGSRENTYLFDPDPVATEEDTDDVFNLDAYLGVDWRPDEKWSVTAGYMVQAYWNIRAAEIVGNSDVSLDRDSIAHGPFLKVQYGF